MILVQRGRDCLFGLGERLFVWSQGEIQILSVHTSRESCIVRGSCISGGVLSFFMLFAGCVELCLFLEGPALHMLGCVEPCLFLGGLFWSQCVEPLPLSWGLTLLALLSSSDLFRLSFAFDHLS